MSDRDGIKGAMAQAVAGASQALAERPVESQDDLFNVPAMPHVPRREGYAVKDGYVPAEGGLEPRELEAEAERQRKAGRPKGAQNRSTRELKEFLLKTGVVPQTFMHKWLNIEPEQLAKRLGCTVFEAFNKQIDIARELGEYIIPKMARTDGQGNAVPLMGLFVNGAIIDPQTAQPASGLKPWQYPGADNDVVDVEAETSEPAA